MVFRDHGFFFPNIFCWFLFGMNRDEDNVRESFSVKFNFTLSITLGYIFLWNVIRRIYLPCLQLISKKYFDESWQGTPPPLFLVQKWKNGLWWMTFVMDNCLLDLFVVLDLDSEPIWIDNSCLFFICLSKVGVKYYLFNLIWQQYEKRHSVYMCRFLWKCPIQDMNVKCLKIQSTYFVNHDIYMYIGSIA
jgi:hypothetical protein